MSETAVRILLRMVEEINFDRDGFKKAKELAEEFADEIDILLAQIERKDEALRNIKIGAERIQNIEYGWEGDCGAKRHIEDIAEKALQNKEADDE